MSIRESINEIRVLHDAYAVVRYEDKGYNVIELIEKREIEPKKTM